MSPADASPPGDGEAPRRDSGRTRRDGKPRKDWCRNPEWTPLAREKFFLRLSSVSTPVKYLRRKASYLMDGNPEAAFDLLSLAAGQARGASETVSVQRDLARAAIASGRPHDAGNAWRTALATAGDEALRVQTTVEFIAFVTGHQRVDDYAEAARLAADLDEKLLDPVQRFLVHAARALLADARGDDEQARLDANSAFTAHRCFASGPRHFPEAGLSDARATGLYARLFALAGDTLF